MQQFVAHRASARRATPARCYHEVSTSLWIHVKVRSCSNRQSVVLCVTWFVFIIQYYLHSANDLIFYQNLGRSISGYTHLITSHIGL